MSIGQQLLDVPFGEMVSNLGLAIAEAQCALDENSIKLLSLMGSEKAVDLPMVSVAYDGGNVNVKDNSFTTSMIGAGFQPTFYQFAETIIEVKIAISISQENTSETKQKGKKVSISRKGISVTPVDAKYSSKYSYNAEGSSLLRTRLVPVPPNTVISQIIDMRTQAMDKIFQIEAAKVAKQIEDANRDYDNDHPEAE